MPTTITWLVIFMSNVAEIIDLHWWGQSRRWLHPWHESGSYQRYNWKSLCSQSVIQHQLPAAVSKITQSFHEYYLHRKNATWPVIQCHCWSIDMPQSTSPIDDNTAPGYPSQRRISGNLSPPFLTARRFISQSLRRPEKNSSAVTVPTIKPLNNRPCTWSE